MHRRCCRPVSWMRCNSPHPVYQPAASWVHYTTSCKHSLMLLRMGEIIAPKHVQLIWIMNKPLLLHLVSLYHCISDVWSYKHQIENEWMNNWMREFVTRVTAQLRSTNYLMLQSPMPGMATSTANWQDFRDWVSATGVAHGSDILGCYAVSTGKLLPTFRRIVFPHYKDFVESFHRDVVRSFLRPYGIQGNSTKGSLFSVFKVTFRSFVVPFDALLRTSGKLHEESQFLIYGLQGHFPKFCSVFSRPSKDFKETLRRVAVPYLRSSRSLSEVL